MIISGTISDAQPVDSTDQNNNRYQWITIQTSAGLVTGRIGSKQGYVAGGQISVTVEQKQGDSGPYNYFKKFNPQYSAAPPPAPQNAPQAPSQPAGRANNKEEVIGDAKDLRMARENGLNNATKIICLLAEMTKNDASLNVNHITGVASELVGYIYNGIKGETPKQNPAPPLRHQTEPDEDDPRDQQPVDEFDQAMEKPY